MVGDSAPSSLRGFKADPWDWTHDDEAVVDAACAIERIAPADAKTHRIGHFGFFRAAFGTRLWPLAARGLAGFTQTQAAQGSASQASRA